MQGWGERAVIGRVGIWDSQDAAAHKDDEITFVLAADVELLYDEDGDYGAEDVHGGVVRCG